MFAAFYEKAFHQKTGTSPNIYDFSFMCYDMPSCCFRPCR